jgi:hypothetical protein
MLKTYFSLFFFHLVMWWAVFDTKFGGGGEENAVKVLSVQFLPFEPHCKRRRQPVLAN